MAVIRSTAAVAAKAFRARISGLLEASWPADVKPVAGKIGPCDRLRLEISPVPVCRSAARAGGPGPAEPARRNLVMQGRERYLDRPPEKAPKNPAITNTKMMMIEIRA
jgi:hypothetical protein